MVFDAVRQATDHVKFECEKCEHKFKSLNIISFKPSSTGSFEKYRVCNSCAEKLESEIENHFWYDVVSKNDFERIISYLNSVDKIDCVYDDEYTAGDIIIHTKYATSKIVSDACEHFGYKVHSFGPEDNKSDCFEDHGECFTICIVPDGNIEPIPESITEKSYSELDYINESDKIFG